MTTQHNTTRCLCIARWITKATGTHSLYLILIACPGQKLLRESAATLRHTYVCIACVVFIVFWVEDSTSRCLGAFAQSRKQVIDLSCPSIRSSVRLSACFKAVSTGRISVKLATGDVYENCRDNPNLVKIEQKYWIIHMETQACCTQVAATCVAQQLRDRIVAFPWQRFHYFFYAVARDRRTSTVQSDCIVAFSRQQCLRESATLLHYTYIAFLLAHSLRFLPYKATNQAKCFVCHNIFKLLKLI